MSHSPLTSADRPPIERWLTSPQVAHGGMWIYIDPSTAYRDAWIGEQFDGGRRSWRRGPCPSRAPECLNEALLQSH